MDDETKSAVWTMTVIIGGMVLLIAAPSVNDWFRTGRFQ